MILYREEELESGDLLMVAKNNYFWAEGSKEVDFIANGDIAVVRRVRREREMYGFRFADVTLRFPDYNDVELETTVLLDTLHVETPALPKEMNDKLFYAVLEDYADITIKRERMKKMKSDPYYNALQVKKCLVGNINNWFFLNCFNSDAPYQKTMSIDAVRCPLGCPVFGAGDRDRFYHGLTAIQLAVSNSPPDCCI